GGRVYLPAFFKLGRFVTFYLSLTACLPWRQHLCHRGQHARRNPAVDPGAPALGDDQSCLPQLLQMVADRGLGDAHVLDVNNGGFPALMRRDPGEKPEPNRVGQRLEHAGHALRVRGRKLRRAKRRAWKLNGRLPDEFRWNRHGGNTRLYEWSLPPI